jgi:hypothetical protein
MHPCKIPRRARDVHWLTWRPVSRFRRIRHGMVVQTAPNRFQDGSRGAGFRQETRIKSVNEIRLAPASLRAVAAHENHLEPGVSRCNRRANSRPVRSPGITRSVSSRHAMCGRGCDHLIPVRHHRFGKLGFACGVRRAAKTIKQPLVTRGCVRHTFARRQRHLLAPRLRGLSGQAAALSRTNALSRTSVRRCPGNQALICFIPSGIEHLRLFQSAPRP